MEVIEDEILEDKLNNQIQFFADCSICGLCCHYNIVFTEEERKKINLQFEQKDGEPCVFLRDNRCIIYDLRPSTCRCFPLEVKGDITLIKGIEKCPAAIGFLECFFDFCEKHFPNSVCPEKNYVDDDMLNGYSIYVVVPTSVLKKFLEFLIE